MDPPAKKSRGSVLGRPVLSRSQAAGTGLLSRIASSILPPATTVVPKSIMNGAPSRAGAATLTGLVDRRGSRPKVGTMAVPGPLHIAMPIMPRSIAMSE